MLRELLYHSGIYSLNITLIDTPLLGLDQGSAEAASENMRTGLFEYMSSNQDKGQIIVVENSRSLPYLNFQSRGVNLIELTEKNGFLPSPD
ncbi:hypothetical protein [Suicoccus acidiformans]|uniref:hypothetical protein n=1 Tax=Suicoccus acidiformans TaxID=2036206 RepID=UPI0013C344DE|nr:hypothetical protein [Suicoccus acidiformans]